MTDLCSYVNSMGTPLDGPDPLTRLCDIFQGCPRLGSCREDFSAPEPFVCALGGASSLCDAYGDCWTSEECGFVDCIHENYGPDAADLLHQLTCDSDRVECSANDECGPDNLCVEGECQSAPPLHSVSNDCLDFIQFQYEDDTDVCLFLSSCASDESGSSCLEFYEFCAAYQEELLVLYCDG